jgi:UDP-N-acetylmuramate dehydrogenase
LLHAGAGATLSEIVLLTEKRSLSGMEFCAGIPGSVGGAVKMNAGAWGNEIKDVIETVELMIISGEILESRKDDLKFTYRNLDISEGTIIVGASFLLARGIEGQVHARINEILGKRKDRHPLEYRNAGSVFKNPNGGIPAGRIIDELGLKGIQIGNARISEKHGNFIVNLGNAKASDIIALIDMIKAKVNKERGIMLQTEVMIVGEDG